MGNEAFLPRYPMIINHKSCPHFIGAVLAGSLWLSVGLAPAPADTGIEVVRGGTLNLISRQEPDLLNTALSSMQAARDLQNLFMSGLVTVNDRLEAAPDLALAVPTLQNKGVTLTPAGGMIVTYRLRSDVNWHDGVHFSGNDVRFTWEAIVHPKVPAVTRQGYDKIERIDVSADGQAVTMHFKEVYAPYQLLFREILPRHVFGRPENVTTRNSFGRQPIGTGPFIFRQWVPGRYLAAAANPRYYRGRPYLSGIAIHFEPNDEAVAARVLEGQVDVYPGVPLPQMSQMQSRPDLELIQSPALAIEHLDLNLSRSILADGRVRRALSHAINKDELADRTFRGVFKPAWSDLPSTSWAFDQAVVNKYPYDPEMAAALLEEAGWRLGADGLRSDNRGDHLVLTLATTQGNRQRNLIVQLLEQYFRRIGVSLKVANYSDRELFAAREGILDTGRFDLALYAWVLDPDPDNLTLWHSGQIPPRGHNYTRFRHAEVDRLTVLGTRTLAREARLPVYRRIAQILSDAVPAIPLLERASVDAVSVRVHNWRPNPSGQGNLWNCYEWWMTSQGVPLTLTLSPGRGEGIRGRPVELLRVVGDVAKGHKDPIPPP